MKVKPKKNAEKPKAANASANGESDINFSLAAIAGAAGDIAGELHPLYHVETLADNVGALSSALGHLADATALSVIATHGTEDDRIAAVKYAKRWLHGFDEE